MSLLSEDPESTRSRSGRAEHRTAVARGGRSMRSDSYHDLDDEDKLVRLAGTIAAAEAERAALERRIAQKAVVINLEKQLAEQVEATRQAQRWAQDLEHTRNEAVRARQGDEMRFQNALSALQAEANHLADVISTKDREAEAREKEYLQLHEEAVSFREDNQGLRGQNSSLRQQLSAQSATTARNQTLRQENQRLKDEADAKDAKIRQLDDLVYQLEESERRLQLEVRAGRQADIPRAIALASGIYGPVGRPPGFQEPGFNDFHSEAQFHTGPNGAPMGPPPSAPMGNPLSTSMGRPPSAPMSGPPSGAVMFHTGPMPIMSSMGFSHAPLPPPQNHPYLPGSLSSEPSQQPSSEGGAHSEVSNQVPFSPGAVSISPRNMMQDEAMASVDESEQANNEAPITNSLPPTNEPIPTVPEPVQQAPLDNLPEPMQQVPVDGQAFLAKLQRKGSEFDGPHSRPLAANGVPAVHEPIGLAVQAPPPPVQNSRSAPVAEEVTEAHRNIGKGQTDEVQPINQAAGRSIPSAAQEPSRAAPLKPVVPIYVPAMPQGHMGSLPQREQRQYKDNVNALFHSSVQDTGAASDLTGQYVPAMPPGFPTGQVSNSQAVAAQPGQNQRSTRNKKKKGKGRGQKRGQQGEQDPDRNCSTSQRAVSGSDGQPAQNDALPQRQGGNRKKRASSGNRRNGSARNEQQA